jgi:arylsulfatase A-like enzyme/L-ascorbate metabolism protein UlaG (beta-lactamase superfamily)
MEGKILNRREFVKGAIGLGGACLGFSRLLSSSARGKPNFVFFLIDDLGWADIGCFSSRFYETPNIDKVAAGGMRFTDAYAACPVCSPTRASIMCGKYPARIDLTNYLKGMRRGRLNPPAYADQMGLEEVTIAEALKDAGYTTCFVGKWHLGGQAYYPEHQGFDINIGGSSSGAPRSYFWPAWKGNPPIEGEDGQYLTDKLTDEAVKFLDAHDDKPFLLYLSHYAVHVPLGAKKELIEKYQAKAARNPAGEPRFLPEGDVQARQVQDHAVYAAMVESVDQGVGRVLDKLEELGVADDTVVMFMSDNGGLSTAEGQPTSNLPLRAGKGWLYEGGIREPMIIKWPGVTRAGSVCHEPVISTDFYPTMLEMAGLALRPLQHVDGVSLVPLLEGGLSLGRKAIYWHYPHYSNQGGGPAGAVRAGDFKLIESYEDNRLELYNIRQDVGEKNDLAAKMPEKAAELLAMIRAWRQDVNAKMPTPNPDYGQGKEKQAMGKDTATSLQITWLGHASFRISAGQTVVYIDPWKLKTSPEDANLVLVSHGHYDHHSPEDIRKVSSANTKLVGPADVIGKQNAGQVLTPGQTVDVGSVRVTGVAAYNPSKQFHPKSNKWLGFVIEIGGKKIYYAGDTDVVDEMKSLKGIDVAFLPVGGTYTMDAGEAAKAVKLIGPKTAIPYHWGDIVGSGKDAESFAAKAACAVKILKVGETAEF